MNAIQFIKDYGVEKARKVIDGAPKWAMSINFNNGMYYSRMEHKKGDTFLYDIKRLVESEDMVKEYGGISMAKRQCACFTNACTSVGVKPSPRLSALQQAIADYESIYGGEHV